MLSVHWCSRVKLAPRVSVPRSNNKANGELVSEWELRANRSFWTYESLWDLMGWVWECSEGWPKAQQSPSVSPLKDHGEQVKFSMIGKAQIHIHLPKRRSGKQQRSQLQVTPRTHYETGPHRSSCHKHDRQENWEDMTWVGPWQMIDQVIAISDEATCSVDEVRAEIVIWLHFSNTIHTASIIHLENYIMKWILVYKYNVYHTNESGSN